MIDWAEVNAVLEKWALDEGHLEPEVVDAVLLKSMYEAVIQDGKPRRLGPEELNTSILFPFGGPQWPWQNPAALAVLADEPGFDLPTLLANLPT